MSLGNTSTRGEGERQTAEVLRVVARHAQHEERDGRSACDHGGA